MGPPQTREPRPARPPASVSRGRAMPPSSRGPIATRSRSSTRRRRTAPGARAPAPRADGRVAPSPTTAARRRSWPSTWPTRPAPTSSSRPAATPTSPTSACSRSPERTLVFDANDFDETLPGPWEWDVKRLAASIVIAGRANGFSAAQNREATMAAVRGYRQWMGRYAGMASSTSGTRRSPTPTSGRPPSRQACSQGKTAAARAPGCSRPIFSKARRKDGMRAFESLTAVVDGRRVILDDPPVDHARRARRSAPAALEKVFTDYRATMPENRASSSSAIASSTAPSRSSASGASGRAASWSSSRAATRTTR